MKLCAKSLGIAAGIMWGVSMFVMTWVSMYTGYGALWLEVMASVYPGFDISPVGSVVGLIYGFLDCFIGFFIVGWIYNKVSP